MFVSLQCWQLVSTETWVSAFYAGGSSHPLWVEVHILPSSRRRVLQRLLRIKIYLCFTSSEAHPCHLHEIGHLRPSSRGNSKSATTCQHLLMTQEHEQGSNRPWHLHSFSRLCTPSGLPPPTGSLCFRHRDLSFSIVCVSNGLWAHIHHPPLHLRVLNSAFKNSTPSRKKSTQHLAALKESFQGLLFWHSWYSFPSFFWFHYFKTFHNWKMSIHDIHTHFERKRKWTPRCQSSGLIKLYGKLLGTFS